MRFLVDECAGPALANWLLENGHDVFSVFDQSPGITDNEVLSIAINENRILITIDKDFGELVYRQKQTHKGVILFRLIDQRSTVKISVLKRVIEQYSEQLENNFTVVSEDQVRFAYRNTK